MNKQLYTYEQQETRWSEKQNLVENVFLVKSETLMIWRRTETEIWVTKNELIKY